MKWTVSYTTCASLRDLQKRTDQSLELHTNARLWRIYATQSFFIVSKQGVNQERRTGLLLPFRHKTACTPKVTSRNVS